MRRCGFETFTPSPLPFEGAKGNVPSSARREDSAAAIDAQVEAFGWPPGAIITALTNQTICSAELRRRLNRPVPNRPHLSDGRFAARTDHAGGIFGGILEDLTGQGVCYVHGLLRFSACRFNSRRPTNTQSPNPYRLGFFCAFPQ